MGFEQDPDGVIRAQALRGLDWLEHGFGTLQSEGWAPPERTATLKQVHSASVIVAERPAECLGEGDAMVTNCPGVRLAIRTADCIPVLLADHKRRAVAAIHAGWRGTASQIAEAAVATMRQQFGSEPADLHAAIGPGIGACCYEVGAEVVLCLAQFLPEVRSKTLPAKINLVEANRRQLVAAGIPKGQIEAAGMCTRCLTGRFHSFRRDGEKAGRMVSAIEIRQP